MNENYAYYISRDDDDSAYADFGARLREHGVESDHIYTDRQSTDTVLIRHKYKAVMSALKEGDTLFIRNLSDLAAEPPKIILQWNRITKEKRANIVVLGHPLIDTRQQFSGEKRREEVSGVMGAILGYMKDNWDSAYTLSHRPDLRRTIEVDQIIQAAEAVDAMKVADPINAVTA